MHIRFLVPGVGVGDDCGPSLRSQFLRFALSHCVVDCLMTLMARILHWREGSGGSLRGSCVPPNPVVPANPAAVQCSAPPVDHKHKHPKSIQHGDWRQCTSITGRHDHVERRCPEERYLHDLVVQGELAVLTSCPPGRGGRPGAALVVRRWALHLPGAVLARLAAARACSACLHRFSIHRGRKRGPVPGFLPAMHWIWASVDSCRAAAARHHADPAVQQAERPRLDGLPLRPPGREGTAAGPPHLQLPGHPVPRGQAGGRPCPSSGLRSGG